MPLGVLPSESGTTVRSGSATLDFGTGAGGSYSYVDVVGQTDIVAGSAVEVFLMGDTTASHNAYEHELVPLIVRAGQIVPGVGFRIHAFTTFRLTGTFLVRWSWS